MLRVYECLTQEHDLRLIALAAIVCALACYTAFNLIGRAAALDGRARNGWTAVAAVVTGCGVWATHFVAMLAFRPGFPVGYDVGLTLLSVAVAIVFSGVGYWVGLRYGKLLLAGAIIGVAIGSMHFIGMSALLVSASKTTDAAYVLASLALGMAFGALACKVGLAGGVSLGRRVAATGLMVLAICGLHFTAMAAVSMTYDPTIPVFDSLLAPDLLAISVTAVTILIVALGLAGAIFDQHLADRSAREAARLRQHVAALEETRRALAERTNQATEALARAEEASAAKSQFLAAMSHELRTPLNAIIGFAEVQEAEIFGPMGDPRYRSYAGDIRQSGQHLLSLINDILDFTKLDGDHLKLTEEPVDLAAIVAEAAHMVDAQAKKSRIEIRVDLADGLPEVVGDRRRLCQILLNLLSNAVKFTPGGGRVTVSARRHASGLAIAVADTGIGMSAQDIEIAVMAFRQIDSRLSREYEGTGLGLPLSKRLAELHGGTLEIASAVDVGTTVTVFLPESRLRTPSSEPLASRPPADQAGSGSVAAPSAGALAAAPSRLNIR